MNLKDPKRGKGRIWMEEKKGGNYVILLSSQKIPKHKKIS